MPCSIRFVQYKRCRGDHRPREARLLAGVVCPIKSVVVNLDMATDCGPRRVFYCHALRPSL